LGVYCGQLTWSDAEARDDPDHAGHAHVAHEGVVNLSRVNESQQIWSTHLLTQQQQQEKQQQQQERQQQEKQQEKQQEQQQEQQEQQERDHHHQQQQHTICTELVVVGPLGSTCQLA